MLPNFSYVRTQSVEEAVQHLSDSGARLYAGGTDLLGCLRDGVFSADKVVSLGGIEQLSGIRQARDGGLRIGALTPIAELASSPLLRERYPGLAQAAGDVASPQLRNQGTLGGNLCQRPRCWYYRGEFHCLKKGGTKCYAVEGENRYHAIFGGGPCHIVHPSDTAPALIALKASLTIEGRRGQRSLPAEEFFELPTFNLTGENVLLRGDILTEIVLPGETAGWKSSYRKVRERGAWDFALSSLALAVRLDGKRVQEARAVLGGVAPIPWRSQAIEEAVTGKQIDSAIARQAAQAAVQGAEPLEQNGYKVALVRGIVEESLLAIV